MILHFDAAVPTSVMIALVFGLKELMRTQRKRIISIPIKTWLINEEDEKLEVEEKNLGNCHQLLLLQSS